MADSAQCTESVIKEAARQVFTAKGFAATRTEDIALAAGVNKALVNYYYRSKDRLFEAVFREEMQELTQAMQRILNDKDLSIFDKIRAIVENDFKLLLRNPDLPLFVMTEIARNPELMHRCGVCEIKNDMLDIFCAQIEEEVQCGTIEPVEPQMLWLNMVSMITMPFLARSWMAHLFGIDDGQYLKLMEQRREHIADFIINSIQKKPTKQGA